MFDANQNLPEWSNAPGPGTADLQGLHLTISLWFSNFHQCQNGFVQMRDGVKSFSALIHDPGLVRLLPHLLTYLINREQIKHASSGFSERLENPISDSESNPPWRAEDTAVSRAFRGTDRAAGAGVIIYLLPLGAGNTKDDNWHHWSTPLNSFWCCSGSIAESFGKLMDSIYFHRQAVLPLPAYWQPTGSLLAVANRAANFAETEPLPKHASLSAELFTV